VNKIINKVLPKTNGVLFVWNIDSNPSELGVQPENILPPEGTLLSSKMWDSIRVVPIPNKVYPLNIFFSIEFFQLFQQKSIIL
jgi:hypothetical protein